MKKLQKLFVLAGLLLLASQASVRAQQMPPMPIDPDVRIGKLENGLTYYVRHNALPENQAYFYIAQKVGSVQEEESQRGLAHFLEHMCFNGTQNFPGDAIVNYCEKIGVKFGQNLNAYTSTDETVYNIDNVPVNLPGTEGNIDSCLLILHDWSGALLLETEEIDKERGVIHEEWRMRDSGAMRIYTRNLETLYPGSRYGRRMPIGLMSVVDNFEPDTLRAYYHKWYHPDLQAIIVVGDINVDEVEGKIKQIFSPLTNPENEVAYELYPVPDNEEAIYIVDKDKEMQQTIISLWYKQEALSHEQNGSMEKLLQGYFTDLISHSLNERLRDISKQADCPFLQASSDYGHYFISKTADAFELSIVPKNGEDAAAVEAVIKEVKRAAEFGFTPTELNRASEEILSRLERIYDNRDKQRSSFFVPQYVRHFLEGDFIASIEQEYETLKTLSQQLLAANMLTPMVNAAFKEIVSENEKNFVVLAMYPEKEDVTVPTAETLKAAVASGLNAEVEAFVDDVKNEPLVPVLPKLGKIKSETPADFGYTLLTLANGAKIYYKQTDFNKSQVILEGISAGGLNEINYKDTKTRVNANLATQIQGMTGLGNFSASELSKALAGKQASISTSIGSSTESIMGNATPKDLRTLFEMLYLTFTNPGVDQQAYDNLISTVKASMENAEKQPEVAFSDSAQATLYNHDLRAKRITRADLELADYAQMQEIFRQRFNSPSDFTFFVTGAFDVDSLRLYAQQFVGSIKKAKKAEKDQNPNLNFVDGVVTNRFIREMETPKGNIIQIWHGNRPYSLEEDQVVNALGEILSQRLLKSIREDAGIAYSCGSSASSDYGYKEEYTLQIYCPVQPAKADSALLLMQQGIEEIAQGGVTEDELDKVKKFQVKQFNDNQKQNSYWQGLIRTKVRWNKDNQAGYVEAVNAVTTEAVQKFCRDVLLKDNNKITVVMLPASLEEKE
ncbi:MAG: insulinase family protein [Alloprevotella sp.]|nr:insulinase family protein [Alloprevotella sp.]